MRSVLKVIRRLPAAAITIVFAIAAVFISVGVYQGGSALHTLFAENRELRQALTNLTDEGKIGYAKVLSQERDAKGNVLSTTLKFVETARDNDLETILEKQYTVEGEIVHFDALIVKFGNKIVMDGKQRSLYLWRRVYGEQMPPQQGYPIEEAGAEPQRYRDLLVQLRLRDRELFWSSIWELANDPHLLAQYDVEAIYGNVTYTKLKKGLVYVFRITAAGQVYPEVFADI